MMRFIEIREEVLTKFNELGFLYVTLDLMGFRSGSMDEVLEHHNDFKEVNPSSK